MRALTHKVIGSQIQLFQSVTRTQRCQLLDVTGKSILAQMQSRQKDHTTKGIGNCSREAAKNELPNEARQTSLDVNAYAHDSGVNKHYVLISSQVELMQMAQLR